MKTSLSDCSIQATRFQALSDPTRLGVLLRLAGGERCVCDLTDDLGAAQSRLSFHLKQLKDAGLVHDRRQGRWVYYALDRDVLNEMNAFITELRENSEPGCC